MTPFRRSSSSSQGLQANPDNNRRRHTVKLLGSAAIKGSGMGLTLLVSLLLARALGPHGYGLYSYAYAIVTLLVIPTTMGLPTLAIREASVARSGKDWPTLIGLTRWTGLAAIGGSLAMVAIGGAGAWFWSRHSTTLSFPVFAWGLVLLPGLVLSRTGGGGLRGLGHVLAGQLPDASIRPGIFALFILGALFLAPGLKLNPGQAMALHALAACLAVLAAALLLRHNWPVPKGHAIVPRYRLRFWAASVIPLGLTTSIQVINRQADILLLGILGSASEVGIYRVAMQGALLIGFGLQAVNMVAGPQFARLHAQGNRADLQRVATNVARIALAFALPITILFILFGDRLLGTFIGPEYTGGAIPLAILSVGRLLEAATGSVMLMLNMTHNEGVVARIVAFAAIFNVLANLVLIPLFGMAGAATATTLTLVMWNILLVMQVYKRLGINNTVFTFRRAKP